MENITENQITIVDLDLLRNIVNLACTRGAFNAAEARQVGEVYEKLSNFLKAVVEQAQAQEDVNNLDEPVSDTIDGGDLPPVTKPPKGE
jgi:uncharacterized protein YdbL (DUF1318 family)